jgi:hypothetical protein
MFVERKHKKLINIADTVDNNRNGSRPGAEGGRRKNIYCDRDIQTHWEQTFGMPEEKRSVMGAADITA